MKDVQTHAGHASITTTGNIYMQEIPGSVMQMVEEDEKDVLGTGLNGMRAVGPVQ